MSGQLCNDDQEFFFSMYGTDDDDDGINTDDSQFNDFLDLPDKSIDDEMPAPFKDPVDQFDNSRGQLNQLDNDQEQPQQSDYDEDKSIKSISNQYCSHQQFYNQIAQNMIQFENFEKFKCLSPENFSAEYYAFFKKYSPRKICKELINEYQRLINELFGNKELIFAYNRDAKRTKIAYFKNMSKYADYIFYYLTVLINIGIINLIEDQQEIIKVRDNNKRRTSAKILFKGNNICTKPNQPGMIYDFEIKTERMLVKFYFERKIQSFYYNLTRNNYQQ